MRGYGTETEGESCDVTSYDGNGQAACTGKLLDRRWSFRSLLILVQINKKARKYTICDDLGTQTSQTKHAIA